MIFTSLHFLFYFPLVVGVHYCLPVQKRWLWLLLTSCYFYMAFIPAYILILFFLIVTDYVAGLWIEKSEGHTRRLFLIVSCIANCAILGLFKYFNFFNAQVSTVAEYFHHANPIPDLKWILPIGLSFHTFQSLGYVVDVYRRKTPAEHHFGLYALYVMFFPQLVAGPIERSGHLQPQLEHFKPFDYQLAADGLKLMAWGFFQKMVIADRLAQYVDNAYADPTHFSGLALGLATICFAFQIYADFNAYSNIAIGSAAVLGVRLMNNFDAPYFSTSVRDFWRRWHISLSTWFRDYVYYPLGGNRVSRGRHYINLLIVFLLSGLWHGANWTFCIWGVLHGTLLILGDVVREGRQRLFGEPTEEQSKWMRIPGMLFTFAVVCYAWIFFRASSVHQAFSISKSIGTAIAHPFSLNLPAAIRELSVSIEEFALAIGCIGILLVVDFMRRRVRLRPWISKLPAPQKWTLYYGSMLSFLVLARFLKKSFIYFQF